MNLQSEQVEELDLAPHTLLEHQMGRIVRRIKEREIQCSQYSLYKLILVVGGTLLALFTLAKLGAFVLLVIVLVIGAYMYVSRAGKTMSRSLLLYQSLLRLLKQQQARQTLDWDEMPEVPSREEIEGGEDEHPFDLDLDISGERSLHRLLNTSVSLEGTLRLRDWLLERDLHYEIIRGRRAIVSEMVPLTRFRHRLQTYSLFATRFTNDAVNGKRLIEWLEAQADSKLQLSTLLVSIALSVGLYVSLALYLIAHLSPLFVILFLAGSAIWFTAKHNEQGHLQEDTTYQRTAFGQLQIVFEYLEKYPYRSNVQLKQLCEPFYLHDDRRPSILLKKLERTFSRIAIAASSSNVWFVLNLLFPLGAITAYQLDQYKGDLLTHLPDWLDTWYELEALNSLATFAALNPEYTFPELVHEEDKGASTSMAFDARQMGHPLISKAHKVVNDIRLEQGGEIMLITGSNMAGKSTFLRTMGINLCLAYAGSVVAASFMRTSLFELYACIRVTDSLADGYSYFYAEVRRLKGLLDELKARDHYPLFFMVDEIFKGTNNEERAIGSEAYIRALIGKRCTGAISTHDLELVKLSEAFPLVQNYHFRENIINNQMVFEYLLRSGPSPTRNALRIMAMEGLPVRWEGEPV